MREIYIPGNHRPFEVDKLYIDPPLHKEITLYYWINTVIGNKEPIKTCRQFCEHCFLGYVDPSIVNFAEDLTSAERHISLLRQAGFMVEPVLPDTFSVDFDGKYFLEKTPLFCRPEGRFGTHGGWTSGTTLAVVEETEAFWLLDLAYKDNGISFMQITAHGINGARVPFSGVAREAIVAKAISRVEKFSEKERAGIEVGLTMNIGRHNSDLDFIRRSLDFISRTYPNSVHALRLNAFIAFDPRFAYLQMDDLETRIFLEKLMLIAETNETGVNVSVSEDFGVFPEAGIPKCHGGQLSYGITYPNIWACDEVLQYKVGEIVTIKNPVAQEVSGLIIAWDIKRLQSIVGSNGVKNNLGGGCLAKAFSNVNNAERLKYGIDIPCRFNGEKKVLYP